MAADAGSARDVLAVWNVSKAYPGVLALRDVSLAVRAGTVHALVGENGAGKSTLVKVITGAIAPDGGTIAVGGRTLNALRPRTARALGISVIHQERQIALDLSVTENVLLGRLPRTRAGLVDWAAARREARARLHQLELDVDVRRPVGEIGVAQLQGLELARALSADARVIVMDEPTSALPGREIARLFEIIAALRETGVGVLYISHHLEEVFEVADEVTVLRDGQVVESRPVAGLDTDRLVALMLGHEPGRLAARDVDGGDVGRDPVLRAVGVHRAPGLHGVSLDVRAGEVLCVTGAVGSGRRELARCLAGVQAPEEGAVLLDGRPLAGVRDTIRRGVVFLPEDRKREGLLLDLTVADNVALGRLTFDRSPLASPRRARREAGVFVGRLRIRTRSVTTPVRLLSGGNQQKVVLGRWLNVGARVLVFDEPTAGIDVGTKLELYGLLRELADRGTAVVLFSSDYEEIKLTADRAVVLRRGVVVGELGRGEIDDDRLLALEQGRLRSAAA